jgi:hypothetical protein
MKQSPPVSRPCDAPFTVAPMPDLPSALAAARAAGLDLVVNCTDATPVETVSSQFRLGLWSLCQQNGRAVGAPYAFLDEIASPVPNPAIVLVRDGTTALISLHPQAIRGHYAAALDRLLDMAASLPARAIDARPEGRPWVPSPERHSAPLPSAPLAAVARLIRQRLQDRCFHTLNSEAWMIGVIDKPIEAVRSDDLGNGVRWLGPWDNRRYWADPFGMSGDPMRILCEEVVHDHPTGILKELVLDGAWKVVAERQLEVGVSGHLSYPFLFVNDGVTYCVPESVAAGRVIIHRAVAAGDAWQPYCLALEGVRAADPTLFIHGGLFWLAYSDQDLGSQDTLCLAWAERMSGPWHQHRLNPVKIDVRSARPAGTPFLRDGVLMRPAQDCSRTYGGAIAINRIDICTPDAFTEETVEVIRPHSGSLTPDGLHTLSAWGERTLIDGKRHWANPWVLRFKARRRLGLVPFVRA